MTEQKAKKPNLESAVLEFDNLDELNKALKDGRLELVSTKIYEALSQHKDDVNGEFLHNFPSNANAYFITDPVLSGSHPYRHGDFYNWCVLFFNYHKSG